MKLLRVPVATDEADPANLRPEARRAIERSLEQARRGQVRPAQELLAELEAEAETRRSGGLLARP